MITEQHAHDMGAAGGEAMEEERLLFEAWMRGHCWALCAHWDAKSQQYLSDEEVGGGFSAAAMSTRRIWAAWRDRAALERQAQASSLAMSSAGVGL